MTNITYEDGTLWFEDGATMKAPAEIMRVLGEGEESAITEQVNLSKHAPSCEIFVEGMGLCGSKGDDSAIYLEYYEGKWWLRVWSDINQEDPTHSIDMSGALHSARRQNNEV